VYISWKCDFKSKIRLRSIDARLLEEHCCQISHRSDGNDRVVGQGQSRRLFEEVASTRTITRKTSSDRRLVHALKVRLCYRSGSAAQSCEIWQQSYAAYTVFDNYILQKVILWIWLFCFSSIFASPTEKSSPCLCMTTILKAWRYPSIDAYSRENQSFPIRLSADNPQPRSRLFWKSRPNKNKMSSDRRSVLDLKTAISLFNVVLATNTKLQKSSV